MIEIAFSSSFKRVFKKRIQGQPFLEENFGIELIFLNMILLIIELKLTNFQVT
jgi:hypothetical protein